MIDPKQRWLTNWNTLPSQGWTTGNDPASERVAGPWFRSGWLNVLASRLARHPSFAGMNNLIYEAGTVAQQRPLATSRAAPRAAGSEGRRGGRAADDPRLGRVLRDRGLGRDGRPRRGRLADVQGQAPGAGARAAWGRRQADRRRRAQQRARLRRQHRPGLRAARRAPGRVARRGSADLFRARGALRLKRPGQVAGAARHVPGDRAGGREPPKMPFFDRGTFEEVMELGP